MDALNECFKEHENHVPFTAEEVDELAMEHQ
jgi:hypothetical protein